MGCCALEGGDAVSAIPIRNLINCAAQPFRWRQQEEEMNPKRSKSRHDRKMPMVNPNAAAIDIGATMHMAAVRGDRAQEPVRSFDATCFSVSVYWSLRPLTSSICRRH